MIERIGADYFFFGQAGCRVGRGGGRRFPFPSHPGHRIQCVHGKSQIEGEALSVGRPALRCCLAPEHPDLCQTTLLSFFAYYQSVCLSLAVSL